MTVYGGVFGSGTVFEITSAGQEKVLYSFTGGADGGFPFWAGVGWAGGTLHGATSEGGIGYGVVFKLTPNGKENVLYTFAGWPDGGSPESSLVLDKNGNVYGTTFFDGGSSNGQLQCPLGCGTVFEIIPSGAKTVLYNFIGGTDGSQSINGLLRDANGNLYGATLNGGNSSCDCGTVFEITPTGKEILLYTFQNRADGGNPVGGAVRDAKGIPTARPMKAGSRVPLAAKEGSSR